MKARQVVACAMATAVVLVANVSCGETRTWTGPGDDWFAASNWVDAALQPGVPTVGDTVLVGAGASILLTNETPALTAFTMTGGTLTFSNWFTRLQAQTVTLTDGMLTLPPAFSETEMSNRVWIACGNDFHLGTNARIDVAGRGYAAGEGPGASATTDHGGSHGGRGGRVYRSEFGVGAPAYGITNAPALPGSGGRLNPTYGARKNTGGGVVFIQAEGRLVIDGVVDADGKGDPHYYLGAGAGGSIHLICGTFAGSSNGWLRARGGSAAKHSTDPRGGAGAGGRIAVNYTQADSACAVRFSASRGLSWLEYYGREDNKWWVAAEDGTLWLPDLSLLPGTLTAPRFDGVRLFIGAGVDTWNVDTLDLAHNDFTLAQPGFKVFVTNAATLGSGAVLVLGAVAAAPTPQFTAKSLALAGGATLALYSGSGDAQNFGARLSVSNNLSIGAGSWFIPFAHPYDGAIVRCTMDTLDIAEGGGINAHGRGYAYSHGDGRTTKGYTGAGYGGRGGIRQSKSDQMGGEGLPYGSVAMPREPGSGVLDGFYGRAYGGGAIWLEVHGAATINGTLDAEGGQSYHAYIGGASGGAIYLACGTFVGSATGLLSANGGSAGYYCPGGGGRIAVDYGALAPGNAVRFSSARGTSAEPHTALDRHWWWLAAQDGTLWLPDDQLLTSVMSNGRFSGLRLVVAGLTHWTVPSLDLRDVSFALETESGARMPVTVANGMFLDNATLDGVTTLTCGGNVTVTNGGLLGVIDAALAGEVLLTDGAGLLVFAGATNGVDQICGAEVRIGGSLILTDNAWVYPFCDATNGGAPRFFVRDLHVDAISGFNADSRGFRGGSGPAFPPNAYLGAGHGGSGGRSSYTALLPRPPYGNPLAPVLPGSGTVASYQYGITRGGGVIWIEADNTARLQGTLRANGASASDFHSYPGSGAGGGILLAARRFEGDVATSIQANGGSSGARGGGGGGGRVALIKRGQRSPVDQLLSGGPTAGVRLTAAPAGFATAVTVDGGTGQADITSSTNPDDYAQEGTIRFLEGPADGTVLLVR